MYAATMRTGSHELRWNYSFNLVCASGKAAFKRVKDGLKLPEYQFLCIK